MKHKTLRKLWASLFREGQKEEGQAARCGPAPRVDPLTVGLRIDLSVPSGAGKQTEASQFVWVSPTDGIRPVRALRVLLLPN